MSKLASTSTGDNNSRLFYMNYATTMKAYYSFINRFFSTHIHETITTFLTSNEITTTLNSWYIIIYNSYFNLFVHNWSSKNGHGHQLKEGNNQLTLNPKKWHNQDTEDWLSIEGNQKTGHTIEMQRIDNKKRAYERYPPSIISSRHSKMRSKFSSASFFSTLPLENKKQKLNIYQYYNR